MRRDADREAFETALVEGQFWEPVEGDVSDGPGGAPSQMQIETGELVYIVFTSPSRLESWDEQDIFEPCPLAGSELFVRAAREAIGVLVNPGAARVHLPAPEVAAIAAEVDAGDVVGE